MADVEFDFLAAFEEGKTLGTSTGLSGAELLTFARKEAELARTRRDKIAADKLRWEEREADIKRADEVKELRVRELSLERAKLRDREIQRTAEETRKKEAEALETRRHNDRLTEQRVRDNKVESAKITFPKWDEKHEDIAQYLEKFERFATQCEWDKTSWARRVCTLLNTRADELIAALTPDDAAKYDVVKAALYEGFKCTAESYRTKFRDCKRKNDETFQSYSNRLERLLGHWMELAKKKKTYEDLYDLVLLEQFIDGIPKPVTTYVRTNQAADMKETIRLAQAFCDARPDAKFDHDDKHFPKRGRQGNSPRKGNSNLNSPQVASNPSSNSNWTTTRGDGHGRPDKPKNWGLDSGVLSERRSKGLCFKCGKGQHLARDCTAPKVVNKLCAPQTERPILDDDVTQRNDLDMNSRLCPGCTKVTSDETFDTTVWVNGSPHVGLRDTQCPTLLIRADVAGEVPLTGRMYKLYGAFENPGQARECPIGIVDFKSPFFEGKVEAAIAKNLSSPVLIGNVVTRGGTEYKVPVFGTVPRACHAIQTRAQARREEEGDTPLKLTGPTTATGKSAPEIAALQEADPSISSLRKLARERAQPKQQGKGVVRFMYKKGLLYREYQGEDNVDHRQLVAPEDVRRDVLSLAHDAPMAGHLGSHKTRDRIWQTFYWPGMCKDIRRYVASCATCQRTVPKGSVRRVPLEKMPLVDVPFRQVAVDLVGPIRPSSNRGHSYILVQVDYATRYPEATPLKKIDTATIAEALWEMWTRVGIPERVISDNGSQFTSGVMDEVHNLLTINGVHTSPYHAMANGLVERFNGTLKQMLKRLCKEQPREWDRFIPASLFAYREVPQESLKFSPFELLYGRTVRGPLHVLRHLWTREENSSDPLDAAEYVVGLRSRIEKTCELARENLGKAAARYAKQADKKSVDRQFQAGDKVLLLLPMKNNKLEIAWKGPYEVKERCGPCDYRVQAGNKLKVYHANLLKKFVERDPPIARISVVIEEVDPSETVDFQDQRSSIPLVPLVAEEGPEDVVLGENLNHKERGDMQKLVHEFGHRFTDVPGSTNLEECEIVLLSEEPVRVRQYPLPHSAVESIREEIQAMLRLGVIEPCVSPYSAPLVLVRKPDGKIRTCQDFRRLNCQVRFDAEPLPDVDQIFAKLAKAKYLSKFDLTKGYWQIPVRPQDRDKTAFTTPQGQFRWVTMPFGLKTAGAIFSRMMRKLLAPLNRDDVHNFVDDVIAGTETWQQHLCATRAFLQRLDEANLVVRPNKCYLGFDEISFLGHRVGNGLLRPEADKLEKFKGLEVPTTKREVRRYLGMIGFYRRFVPNYSQIALPLTDLTKGAKTGHVTWTAACQKAFDGLKQALVTDPVLRLPDPSKTFILRTDASDQGLGAVLLQEGPDGQEPVSFASKKLAAAEKNYSTIEKECYAIVWAVRKFEPHLFGRKFRVVTDHQPLQYLQQARPHSGRLARWAMQLQAYEFTIETVKGVENVDADFWSRIGLDL